MAEFVIEDYYGMRIEVNKVGGGTVGKSYTGRWEVSIDGEGFLPYDSGMPKTHEDVALDAGDYVITESG